MLISKVHDACSKRTLKPLIQALQFLFVSMISFCFAYAQPTLNLKNGDTDGNNAIGPLVINDFDLFNVSNDLYGTPNYSGITDINEDGIVDDTDYDILIKNFLTYGDPPASVPNFKETILLAP